MDFYFDTFLEHIDFDDNGIFLSKELDIELYRKSLDKKKNNFRNRLLELYRCNNIYICNGRIGEDKGVGSCTSKNASVVDYVLCSPNILKQVVDFSILEASKLFSDVHNPLSLSLKCLKNGCYKKSKYFQEEKIKNWDDDKKGEFIENIDTEKLDEILFELSYMTEHEYDNSTVNELVEKLGLLLTNSARSTFGTFTKHASENKNGKKHKPWFNTECKEARKKFRCSKRKLKNNHAQTLVDETKNLEKKYKKVMDQSIRKHRKKIKQKNKKSAF